MNPRRGLPGRRRGASLVELMVGLVLGLIVVLVGTMMFSGSRQANRTADSLGRLQETARSAFDLLAREVREAGGNPCDNIVIVANALTAGNATPPAWWAIWANPFQGFEGNAAFPGATFGTAVAERVDGTDALITKFAADLDDLKVVSHDQDTAVFTVGNSPHRVIAGELFMACSYGQGAIAQASAVTANTITHAVSAAPAGNCTIGLGLPSTCLASAPYTFAPGSRIGRFTTAGWYIGNNGRADSGGRSLYRVTRDGAEEISEGVQDMQVQYLANGGTSYVDASAIADWGQVLGARVTLTLRSAQTGVSTAADGRLARTLVFTLSIRNRQS